MKNLFVSIVCLVFFLASCSMNHMATSGSDGSNQNVELENPGMAAKSTAGLDYREPSRNPPNGLKPEECPQLIILGFDDNQFADGMINTLNVYKNKFNPAGSGQAATFDGAPVHVSFYNNPAGRDLSVPEEWTVSDATIAQWKESYLQGHEVGNHTYYHEHGLSFTKERWLDEMTRTNDFLVNKVGIPAGKITGFRTPFLEYNLNTYYAMQEVGLTYDCSFEGGWRYWPAEDGSTLYWPFTMDNGKPPNEDGRTLPKIPGMWQIPNDCVFFPGGRTTGFDYNIWFSKSATKNEFVEILKYSLDKKYNGNRAPMKFGLHTNYYSDEAIEEMKIYDPASLAKLKTTVVERTQALEEFLAYALTLPDVRVVSAQEALTWIRNPVPLADTPPVQYTVTASAGTNGQISPSGAQKVYKGGSITFTAQPDAGYVAAGITVSTDPNAALDGNNRYTLSNVQSDAAVEVTFKKAVTYTITATSGPNGSLDKEGAIVVAEGSSVSFNAAPDAGYVVDTVTVDGVDKGAAVPYTFNNVTADHTIHVTFKQPTTYRITATSGPNGKWDKEGVSFVVEGGSFTLNALADTGFAVENVTVDGVDKGAVTSYTFDTVTGDHTINVTFKDVPNDVKVVYEITQDWGTGFGGKVTIINNSGQAIEGWQVVWTYPGAERVTALWNASYSQSGNKVTVSNVSWNGTIPAGTSTSFGFNGVYSGTNEVPTDIKVIY